MFDKSWIIFQVKAILSEFYDGFTFLICYSKFFFFIFPSNLWMKLKFSLFFLIFAIESRLPLRDLQFLVFGFLEIYFDRRYYKKDFYVWLRRHEVLQSEAYRIEFFNVYAFFACKFKPVPSFFFILLHSCISLI